MADALAAETLTQCVYESLVGTAPQPIWAYAKRVVGLSPEKAPASPAAAPPKRTDNNVEIALPGCTMFHLWGVH